MKKILLVLLYLVSLLLLAGTGVVHYFTKAKMGMARYMVYFNGKIDDTLGGVGKGKMFLVVLIVIISLITISLIVLTFKNLRGSLINAFSLFYIIALDRGKARDYYLNGIVYVVVGILLIIALSMNLRGKDETK